jgi:cytochrome c oxidase subunit 3
MSAPADSLEPFATAQQKHHADRFGMVVFLASEIMLFGAIFAALTADRILHPGAAALASSKLDMWLGATNTAILLTSSLFVALGGVAAKAGKRSQVAIWFLLAALLGLAFLGVKAVEYHKDYVEGLMPNLGPISPLDGRPASLFIGLYWIATSLHAVHLLIGIGLVGGVGIKAARKTLAVPQHAMTVEVIGLYWHLVDIIWVFLFPLLYLARPA